tara:strand:+ start:64 stop:324 length:261 start_codon:yes stop_codon:yes gene_type:complete
MIKMASPKQIIVFVVNMDSPSKNQVSMGNIINPAEDPINLAVHADPVSSTIILQEYQNAIEHGTPSNIAAHNGFPFHHSDMYWAFS